MNDAPKAFSERFPKLQTAWDASSLKNLQFCPRYYQYVNIEGWQIDNINLSFGRFAADAFERYQKMRLEGATKDDAQLAVLKWLINATWNEDGTQYAGRFEEQWRCTGTEPYKNAKGNKAKCPFSHKGKWFPQPTPGICGECGSDVEEVERYVPEDTRKNRMTLVRTFLWYVEEQPERLEDSLHPIKFPDGTPAVELSWRIPLPWKTAWGEQYLLSGHFDYLGRFGSLNYIVDNKTTTKTLSKRFFESYDPDLQFDIYDMVGGILYPDLELQGVLLDAANSQIEGSSFARMAYRKTEEQRKEQWQDLEFWIKQAERYAEADYWPMKKSSCWICDLKNVCNKPASARPGLLAANFKKGERWNPLIER